MRVTRLARRYPEAVQLIEKFNKKVAANDSAARGGGLDITHLNRVFLLEPEMRTDLLFIEAATVHKEKSSKKKRTALLLSPRAFYFHADALLDRLELAHKKAFPASGWTCEQFLSAQVPRTKTFPLSVEAMSHSTMSPLFHDTLQRREVLAPLAKARF